MFTEEIVDKISDDFQSTFFMVSDVSMTNMLGHGCILDDEKKLKEIIDKYIPGVRIIITRLGTQRFSGASDDYGMYEIYIIPKKGE